MATEEDRLQDENEDRLRDEDRLQEEGGALEAERGSMTDPAETSGSDGPSTMETSPEAPLFQDDQRASYRERWDGIQARFVDDPKGAVNEADELVNAVVTDLEKSFETRRQALEVEWQRGDDVSTEDLRVSLQGYRSFFGRLLGD